VATPTAVVLSIGTEILLGETIDTNAAYLAAEMARLGLALREVRQLPDDRRVLADAFREAMARDPVAVATGGLGPTHDDVTREAVAEAFGEQLREDGGLADELRRRFGGAGRMPAVNLRQAMLIPSAVVLANPIGSAPGWWLERDGRILALLPGVPAEMRRMWVEEVVPRLVSRLDLQRLHLRTVKTFGIGESAVAEKVGDLLESPDDGVEAGIYARDDGVHLRFSTRGDHALLDVAVAQACSLLGDDVYGTDETTLAGLALTALARSGVNSLRSVESGTDGALLAILGAHGPRDGEARYQGGSLLIAAGHEHRGDADAVLTVSLGPPAGLGRSQVRVSLEASAIGFETRELRIHGSGPQRLRRAAFAALDQVRRAARRGTETALPRMKT
jgi:nicotinamide-nucleotide amidase